jgi:hypothetical protein
MYGRESSSLRRPSERRNGGPAATALFLRFQESPSAVATSGIAHMTEDKVLAKISPGEAPLGALVAVADEAEDLHVALDRCECRAHYSSRQKGDMIVEQIRAGRTAVTVLHGLAPNRTQRVV